MTIQKRKTTENSTGERAHKRIMVFMIDAPKRPCLTPSDPLNPFRVTRPYDWSVFCFEFCQEEMKRREEIAVLMTEDEVKFFNKYCDSRDT